MNYGSASDYRNNGELFALSKTAKILSSFGRLVIFDVGANVGHYTRQITSAYGKASYELYLFEPSLPTFLKLKENCKDIQGLHFHQLAMSDHVGEAVLHYEKESSGLSSLYERDLAHRNIQMATKESVPLATLDLFCKENHIDHIHFLKMDVEGHELSVLKGAESLLKNNHISIIQFEFGGCNIDSKTNFRDFYKLLSPQYNLYRILKNGLYPITAYSEYREIYISANYIAVSKELSAF
jgi:FkbM family methyltransferase